MAAISAVLDHAMNVLDQLSSSAPRKSRRAMRDILDSVEDAAESVDEDLCDGVSRCGSDRLESLASQMLAVQGLEPDQAASDCVSLVSSLLDAIRECGSVAVQCESMLSVGSDEEARLGAMEFVRGLSPAPSEAVDAAEASVCGGTRLDSRGTATPAGQARRRLERTLAVETRTRRRADARRARQRRSLTSVIS